jgi:hypothetical protein
MKAAKQLRESQKKAEEEAKRKEEDETKRIEKAKKASENETRNQIAAEVGSSRYEVEMLEKLKAKADSGSKMAEMALKDESISLNAGLQAVDIEEKANTGDEVAKKVLEVVENKKITIPQAKKIIDIAEQKPDKVEIIIKTLPKIAEMEM